MAVITHYKQDNVNIRLALCLTAGALAGAIIGSTLANRLDAQVLRKIFGVFLIIMGCYEFFGKSRAKKVE